MRNIKLIIEGDSSKTNKRAPDIKRKVERLSVRSFLSSGYKLLVWKFPASAYKLQNEDVNFDHMGISSLLRKLEGCLKFLGVRPFSLYIRLLFSKFDFTSERLSNQIAGSSPHKSRQPDLHFQHYKDLHISYCF